MMHSFDGGSGSGIFYYHMCLSKDLGGGGGGGFSPPPIFFIADEDFYTATGP